MKKEFPVPFLCPLPPKGGSSLLKSREAGFRGNKKREPADRLPLVYLPAINSQGSVVSSMSG
jgi:hypothetical protein